jgi:hypothetical protein
VIGDLAPPWVVAHPIGGALHSALFARWHVDAPDSSRCRVRIDATPQGGVANRFRVEKPKPSPSIPERVAYRKGHAPEPATHPGPSGRRVFPTAIPAHNSEASNCPSAGQPECNAPPVGVVATRLCHLSFVICHPRSGSTLAIGYRPTPASLREALRAGIGYSRSLYASR